MKQHKWRFSIAVLFCVLLAACSSDWHFVEHESSQKQQKSPERIISLSPNATEILYGVGAFGRVVAVSDYCDYPPETKNLPHVGGWSNTNLEQVASLHPDLVVLAEAQAPFIKDRLDSLKVTTLSIPSRSVDDAFTAISEIGRATGREHEAQALVTQTRAKLDEVRARTRDSARLRVLCIVDRVPGTLRGLYTATEGSFLAQLVEIAGGQSIAPHAESGFGQISKEAIVTLNPDIIIDMVQSAQGKLAEDPKAVWNELSQVRAVREGRIYPLRDTSVLHPSQFIGNTAQHFAEIIHPEVFGRDGH
jgi:iron complex transport system substrate-binding protein